MRIRVWRKLTNSWGWFWRRVSVNFALGFLAMGVVAALLWSFGLIDSDLRRVVLTAAIGALLVILLVGPERTLSERVKLDWGLLGTILLLLTALLMVISHRQGWSSLFLNAGILLFSSPILLVIGRVVFRKPLLGVRLDLPMTMAMAALIVFVHSAGTYLGLPVASAVSGFAGGGGLGSVLVWRFAHGKADAGLAHLGAAVGKCANGGDVRSRHCLGGIGGRGT